MTGATPSATQRLDRPPGWLHPALAEFAGEVGTEGPVAVEGGRTAWHAGGTCAPGTRLVRAPSGVIEYEPAEMTIRLLAGTTIGELRDALADARQVVTLPADRPEATVGGLFAVGHSDIRRLGTSPTRDALLQARYVSAEGLVVTAGGPTVKNVSGFDLCRLLVGSLGTLGLIGEVILRTWPQPEVELWLGGDCDPFALRDALYRPQAVLWDGGRVWLGLAGYRADVEAEARLVRDRFGLLAVDGPPALPAERFSV
ncbi:MAG: FAD-binding protein, partial [Acidimicrobiia bacterium]|nr:FAD-binding protein [Acidimicrobiia bacterium]